MRPLYRKLLLGEKAVTVMESASRGSLRTFERIRTACSDAAPFLTVEKEGRTIPCDTQLSDKAWFKKGSDVFCRNGPEGASHKRRPTPF